MRSAGKGKLGNLLIKELKNPGPAIYYIRNLGLHLSSLPLFPGAPGNRDLVTS
jgi:hypothetical protein